jgi:ankyrin repeat protein/polyhydroxyalkanoate synthesis regulator phasin
VNATDKDGRTPLFGANIIKARILLDRAANVDAKDNDGHTVLHAGISGNHYVNWKIYSTGSSVTQELRLLLLERGADINTQDNKGHTPLYKAIKELDHCSKWRPIEDALKVIRWLLDNKAAVDVKDEDGNTLLHILVPQIKIKTDNEDEKNIKEKKIQIFCLLLERGVDIEAKNDLGLGQTPLELAHRDVRPILAEHAKKQVKLVPTTNILTTFHSFLRAPENFTVEHLTEMFHAAADLYTFRLPYTVANLFRELHPREKKTIDALIYTELKQLAEQAMVSSECVALFKLILRSAQHRGIIERSQKYVLDNVAEKAAIFSDERFQAMKTNIQHLQQDVGHLQQNVQTLAGEFNHLKSALKRKAQRDIIFGIAKVALAFVGSQAIDLLAGIADFSDLAEVGSVMFDTPVEAVEEGLISGQKMLLNQVIETVVEKAGLHPDHFIEVWSQTALTLKGSTVPFSSLTPPRRKG